MLLSAAKMLDWLGERHQVEACVEASQILDEAISRGFQSQAIRPLEQGGDQGTKAMGQALIDLL
jgi:3-isopropylmalate dehydrogenase